MLAALGFTELGEIRGELAFARFLRLKSLVEKMQASGDRSGLSGSVQGASAEAELVMLFSRANPDALRSVSVACMVWSAAGSLDPLLRLRLGETAVTAAALAVRAAPSDYEDWLLLARAEASLGLWEQAQLCLTRAQELAPPGKVLQIVSSGT
jgi:tetratricopeptide (TPR) repeat protein